MAGSPTKTSPPESDFNKYVQTMGQLTPQWQNVTAKVKI
jgi:hypothetical protein